MIGLLQRDICHRGHRAQGVGMGDEPHSEVNKQFHFYSIVRVTTINILNILTRRNDTAQTGRDFLNQYFNIFYQYSDGKERHGPNGEELFSPMRGATGLWVNQGGKRVSLFR